MHLILSLLFALFSTSALATVPTCPDDQKVITFISLERYENIPASRAVWGMQVRYHGYTIGSAVPEWELETIREGLGLSNIPALIGTPFCTQSFAWSFAINDKAVRFLAEQNGTDYTTPTSDEFLELIVDPLVNGKQINLRHITEADQITLASELFIGGHFSRELDPKVLKNLKKQIATKSDGKLKLEEANPAEFKYGNRCVCGKAHLKVVDTTTGETQQLLMIQELLPVVFMDPGL